MASADDLSRSLGYGLVRAGGGGIVADKRERMIHSLNIDGYRGFRNFEMRDLGRVNLLVGRNNSGKTSVLEALHLLASAGDPRPIWQHCRRRGETLTEARERFPGSEIDIAHLFFGHEVQTGRAFAVSAKNKAARSLVKFMIDEPDEGERDMFGLSDAEAEGLGGFLILRIQALPEVTPRLALPLSRRGGISLDVLDAPLRRSSRRSRTSGRNALYVSTDSLGSDELVRLWEDVQLTPHEDLVLQALRTIEPKIERIAAVAGYRPYDTGRTGFRVKLDGVPSPFPIGSLGGGMWRMLAMAIAVTQCRDGMLFVDEIDTGLHYTVMEDMWRLISTAAKDFNVQVFATTHSDDCVRSLAAICHSEQTADNQVSIQRIEIGRSRAVPFTEPEIRIAAERGIEVR